MFKRTPDLKEKAGLEVIEESVKEADEISKLSLSPPDFSRIISLILENLPLPKINEFPDKLNLSANL